MQIVALDAHRAVALQHDRVAAVAGQRVADHGRCAHLQRDAVVVRDQVARDEPAAGDHAGGISHDAVQRRRHTCASLEARTRCALDEAPHHLGICPRQNSAAHH
jgi:hypothetical protein